MIGNVPDGTSYNIDWEAFRAEAAKDILANLVCKPELYKLYIGKDKKVLAVKDALALADELIKQLKEEKK